jgi:hypothetical protein
VITTDALTIDDCADRILAMLIEAGIVDETLADS